MLSSDSLCLKLPAVTKRPSQKTAVQQGMKKRAQIVTAVVENLSYGKSSPAWSKHVVRRIWWTKSENVLAPEVLKALLQTSHRALLCASHGGTWVVVLLVWLPFTLRVANLGLQVWSELFFE